MIQSWVKWTSILGRQRVPLGHRSLAQSQGQLRAQEGSDGAPKTLLGSVRTGPSLQLLLPAWQARGRTAAGWRPPRKRGGSAPARGSSVRHADAPKIGHPRWSLSLQSTHLEILQEKRCPCFGTTFAKTTLSLSVFSDDNLAKYLYALNCMCRSLMPMDHKSLLIF